MKILNCLAFSVFIITFLGLYTSCQNEEEPMQIEGWDALKVECSGYNYQLNEAGTACECPEGTHYRLEQVPGNQNEITRCRELLEGSYLYKADMEACLYDIRDT